jgi:hypothetical protein
LRPDLNECLLEDRALLAYSPSIPGFIYSSSGWIVLTVPPGFNSALNSFSSGSGSSFTSNGSAGGNIATSFNINGFGTSSIQIGNNTGFSALAAVANRTTSGGGSAGPGGIAGSTMGASGSPANATGYSSSFSSGNNTALNSSNNYGVTTSPVGSIPVQTFSNSGGSTPTVQQNTGTASPSATVNTDASSNYNPVPMPGGNPLGGSSLTNGLLGKKPRTIAPLPIGPGSTTP